MVQMPLALNASLRTVTLSPMGGNFWIEIFLPVSLLSEQLGSCMVPWISSPRIGWFGSSNYVRPVTRCA